MRVQVNAVSFLAREAVGRDVVQVRFLYCAAAGRAGDRAGDALVATLQYAYGAPSKDDRLRAANPLGFKVLEYRKEPEVLRTADDARTPQ